MRCCWGILVAFFLVLAGLRADGAYLPTLPHEPYSVVAPGGSATVTITIASPGVVTWTNHGFQAGQTVYFTTTGALPTGITAGTLYYVIAAGLTTNSFEISTTSGGSAVNTTGSQSGTHTGMGEDTAMLQAAFTNSATTTVYMSPGAYQSCGPLNIPARGRVIGELGNSWFYYQQPNTAKDMLVKLQCGQTGSTSNGTGSAAQRFYGTVTITIASPGVVTWPANFTLTAGQRVFFTTTGALPTGLTATAANFQAPVFYYILNPSGNTSQLALTPGGAAINTSVSQSGTHTGIFNAFVTPGDYSYIRGVGIQGLKWTVAEAAPTQGVSCWDVSSSFYVTMEGDYGVECQKGIFAEEDGSSANGHTEGLHVHGGRYTFNEDWGLYTQNRNSSFISDIVIKDANFALNGPNAVSSTVTITNATPAVVTWTAHGLNVGQSVVFSTTATLPTGISPGINYYVIAAGFGANAFEISATPGGSAVNTSSAGSGTQTGTVSYSTSSGLATQGGVHFDQISNSQFYNNRVEDSNGVGLDIPFSGDTPITIEGNLLDRNKGANARIGGILGGLSFVGNTSNKPFYNMGNTGSTYHLDWSGSNTSVKAIGNTFTVVNNAESTYTDYIYKVESGTTFSSSEFYDAPKAALNGLYVDAGTQTTIAPLVTGPNGSSQSQPAATTTGCTSTITYTMLGLAGSVTPNSSGKIAFQVSGNAFNSTAADGESLQIRYGTGTAPTNNAASAGTAIGAAQSMGTGTSTLPNTFSLQATVSGLNVSTAYWFDLGCKALTGGGGETSNVSMTALEQ